MKKKCNVSLVDTLRGGGGRGGVGGSGRQCSGADLDLI